MLAVSTDSRGSRTKAGGGRTHGITAKRTRGMSSRNMGTTARRPCRHRGGSRHVRPPRKAARGCHWQDPAAATDALHVDERWGREMCAQSAHCTVHVRQPQPKHGHDTPAPRPPWTPVMSSSMRPSPAGSIRRRWCSARGQRAPSAEGPGTRQSWCRQRSLHPPLSNGIRHAAAHLLGCPSCSGWQSSMRPCRHWQRRCRFCGP